MSGPKVSQSYDSKTRRWTQAAGAWRVERRGGALKLSAVSGKG